ncbi:hypothetical protein CVT24_010384 [Panaeolus cyanescens]|uniref:Uncharacterized protein n=1 Tax=Panaeolus cyanescens TaxID=181874 RepID=A0A409YQ49_9AGAR|nr:hypothetical protein CVT24_010384 [Panaeolus cyanescens]
MGAHPSSASTSRPGRGALSDAHPHSPTRITSTTRDSSALPRRRVSLVDGVKKKATKRHRRRVSLFKMRRNVSLES